MREIEIKLRVEDLEGLEEKLKAKGLVISEEVFQHDIIYSNTNDKNNFIDAYEGHIALRIRREGNHTKITLKEQRSNEMDNIEYETEVGDFEVMHNILFKLGWKPEVEVKKTRKKGKIGDYEICLDKVEQLGNFIEIEKLTDDSADPKEVRKELFEVIKEFGLSERDEEIKGYDTQIYQLKIKK